MTGSDVSIVDRSVETTNLWLKELAEELGAGDRQHAYRVLRAFLHALRDRITVDEAAQLAAQLPVLIRGIYYEGWDPSRTPETYKEVEPFLRHMEAEAVDLEDDAEAAAAATAASHVLRRHVTEGEFDDVLAELPRSVRQLVAA